MKELVALRLSSLGDVAMAVPVFLSFHAAYPDYTIRLVSRRRFAPIFAGLPFVTFQAIDPIEKPLNILEWIRFAIQLSKSKPYLVLDLHDVIRTKLIRWLCLLGGSKTYTIDKGREEKKAVIRQKGIDISFLKTTVQRYADVFEKGGFSFNLRSTSIPKIKNSREIIKIGISPFAKQDSKEYGWRNMVVVLKRLASHPEFQISIYGQGQRERTLAESMAENLSNVDIVINTISFQEELLSISKLDVMLAMDSGNGHLAANYDLPVITLWGTTHPCLGFGPYLQPIDNSLFPDKNAYPQLPVSIFGSCRRAGYERSIDSIDPEEIYMKILKVIDLQQ